MFTLKGIAILKRVYIGYYASLSIIFYLNHTKRSVGNVALSDFRERVNEHGPKFSRFVVQ